MLQFYGLREHPFGVSPNPRYLYPSVQHREALASLIFGIENQVGFAALIAEPGTGKTTLLFDVLMRFRERASTAFVFNTQCSGQELLRHILMELQVPGGDSEHDPIRQHQLFTAFVADRQRTKPVVIVIDEAQHLEDSAMEALRLLSNFEAADHKLLHIILAGQPQLGEKLRRTTHTQLLQRIAIINRLARFSPSQTEECITYRLHVAGYGGPALFSKDALRKIIVASDGVPREINRICLNAVYLGFALRQRQIGVEVIEEVLADLDLGHDPRTGALAELQQAESSQLEGIQARAPGTPTTIDTLKTPVPDAVVVPDVFSAPVVKKLATAPIAASPDTAPVVPRADTPVVPKAVISPVAPKTVSLPEPKVDSASAVLRAFSTPVVPRKLSTPTIPKSSKALEEPEGLEESKVVRIFDEWQTHTPIDPAAGMFRPEAPSSEAPVQKAEIKLPAQKLEKTVAKSPKREPFKIRFKKRAAIISALFGAVAISLVLFGLNTSLHQQPSVAASSPAPLVQTQPPAEPEVAQTLTVKPERKILPAKRGTQGSVISVGPVPSAATAGEGYGATSGARSGGSSVYRAAVLEKFVRPAYPITAKRMHIEGDVVLKLNVASDGSVQGIKILSGNSVLARAATEAAQQWRYRPALLNGAPTSAEAKTVLTFRVDDDNN